MAQQLFDPATFQAQRHHHHHHHLPFTPSSSEITGGSSGTDDDMRGAVTVRAPAKRHPPPAGGAVSDPIRPRNRTTAEQLQELNASFCDNPKPSAAARRELAARIGMTPRCVQIWFQNRRAKLRAAAPPRRPALVIHSPPLSWLTGSPSSSSSYDDDLVHTPLEATASVSSPEDAAATMATDDGLVAVAAATTATTATAATGLAPELAPVIRAPPPLPAAAQARPVVTGVPLANNGCRICRQRLLAERMSAHKSVNPYRVLGAYDEHEGSWDRPYEDVALVGAGEAAVRATADWLPRENASPPDVAASVDCLRSPGSHAGWATQPASPLNSMTEPLWRLAGTFEPPLWTVDL